MKAMPFLSLPAAIMGIVLCTFLPFLPGRYDPLAAPLSVMAQIFGKVGLLLVPVGILWAASLQGSWLAGKRRALAWFAVIACGAVGGSIALAGIAVGGFVLGLGTLATGGFMVAKVVRRLRSPASMTPEGARAFALALILVPIAVAVLQGVLAGPATEFSRGRAIRNSAPMIAAIERYRAAHGGYPASLQALWKDYWPAIIGIPEYHYEPSGDAYNLFFEQPNFQLGTREIVMFNPRDQQAFTAHARDRLELAPAELAREQQRGHYAVHPAPYSHWKYFWFD